MQDVLRQQWLELQQRLIGLVQAGSSVSLRIPGKESMWWGLVDDLSPARIDWPVHVMGDSQIHHVIYHARSDVGAILLGGGDFARSLADFGGVMPILFDEQARHIGHMGVPAASIQDIATALQRGGNAALIKGVPAVLGTTGTRMAMNAQLFEKCAKAFTLAKASGARMTLLPWWVVRVANSRLMKDEKRATQCFARGEIPPENRGY
ncbi:hypothetical protein [Pseudomonas orientalis]|uniref:Ribulose-5-phosphate 4-epimerase/Fuculose-1-phosphate aldolase n=1 Tax=Pseudomonas orientalis TaxID=76758 RepID=A0A0R2ZNK3_9PSED|nr:hypothetical protein [Pseudomonas orientalis]AZE88719.1 hypothetical protein C4J97_2018 [Pseudomonas orientalis]KRP62073.1 hypothetical protein TU82_23050 [Pseudomonas orientalis]SDT87207.1 Ribulose-5-phosphate 4-epimerase/Fuculose-1-phosphate aldolase [Pseudomonas orientalis]